MEPLFENHYIWTKKMLREMYFRVFRTWSVIIAALAAVILLIVLVPPLLNGTFLFEFFSLPVVMFLVIAVLYIVFLPMYTASMTFNRLLKLYGSAPEVTVQFFEDHFIDSTTQTGGRLDLSYTLVTKVMETKNLLLVKLSGKSVIIVCKDSFIRGDIAAFRTFLCEKTKKR